MRKIFDLILLFSLLLFLFLQKDKIISQYNYLQASPCDRQITYRIGEVDKGYNLTREQFITKTEEAGRIWDKVVNKKLFAYDPQGKILVNLIYTDRQSMADNLSSLENNLNSGKQSLNSLKAEYNNLQTDFENKLQTFNAEVSTWNKQGGAPEDVFKRLQATQAELQAKADKLNQMAKQLNLAAGQYNFKVSQFNQSAKNFNQSIAVKPEAGLYSGSIPQIDIYLTSSQKELIHTLAHEMGHVLGLSHLDNPHSIMYPYTNEILQPDNRETSQLQVYCSQKNFDLIRERVRMILEAEFKKLSLNEV